MAFSLYDATVANYLQILGAVGGFLEKSLTHFREKGIDPAEIVEARLCVSRSSRSHTIRAVPWRRRRTVCSPRRPVSQTLTMPHFKAW
jgi:hypothetical protein